MIWNIGRVIFGTVYGVIHYQNLLRSIARVGYTIVSCSQCLMALDAEKALEWINKSITRYVMLTKVGTPQIYH